MQSRSQGGPRRYSSPSCKGKERPILWKPGQPAERRRSPHQGIGGCWGPVLSGLGLRRALGRWPLGESYSARRRPGATGSASVSLPVSGRGPPPGRASGAEETRTPGVRQSHCTVGPGPCQFFGPAAAVTVKLMARRRRRSVTVTFQPSRTGRRAPRQLPRRHWQHQAGAEVLRAACLRSEPG